MQETWAQSLGWEDTQEKEMATHSSILAWETPWTEEPGRLQSTGLQRVGHDGATKHSTRSIAHQAPLSMRYSRHEYWSGLPFLSSRDLPNQGIEPISLMSPALAGGFFTTSSKLTNVI